MPRSAPSSIAMPDVAATPCPVRSPTVSKEEPSGSCIASYQSPPIRRAGRRRQVVRGQVEGGRAALRREAQGAAPRREHGLLQLDRDPVLGLRDLPLALQRVTGLPQRALAAAQVADVADHRPHRDGAAVGAEHRLAHHVDGAHRAVGPHDPELAVDRPPVDQAAGHHLGEHLLVLGEQPRRQLVQGERAVLRGAAEDAVQLVGPLHTVGEQIPLRAARPAERADGRRVRQPVLGGQVGEQDLPVGMSRSIPSRNWPRCVPRSSSWWTARSHSARCQRSCGSSVVTALSPSTVSTRVRSWRACEISASTAPGSGGCAAG